MTSIWKSNMTLGDIIDFNQKTMVSHVGIEFIELGDNFLKAKMPVDSRTIQCYGIMHGGASCVLAETVASVAANLCVDQKTHQCVGLEINTSHVRSIKTGWVFGTAKPLHLGKSTQLWEIWIEDEHKKLISITRLRMAVLDKERFGKK